MKIAIVGSGRLAATLAPALKNGGYKVSEIIFRAPASQRQARKLAKSVGATAVLGQNARFEAELVWFCVPDGKIRSAAKEIARSCHGEIKVAFHSSGALVAEELNLLRNRGTAIASVHPLMTFVSGSRPDLKGVPFALEGDPSATAMARKIIKRVGGAVFPIRKQDKAMYHAWGTLASPLVIALLATTEQVAQASGVSLQAARKRMLPILRQTLHNYAAMGPAKAFSGPIVRGDTEILTRHLAALKKIPQAADVYQALARAALRYLPARNKQKSKSMLDPATRR